MNKTFTKLFLENITFQIFLKIPEVIISLVTVSLITRYLTINDFGIYSFVINFVTLFTTLMDFGISPILTRELSRNKTESGLYVGQVILLRSIFCLIFFLIIILFSFVVIKDFHKRLITIVMSFSYLSFPLSSSLSVFYSEFKAWVISIHYVFKKMLLLVCILVVFWANLGLMGIILGHVISENLSVIIFFLISLKFVKPIMKLEVRKIRYILKESFTIFLIISIGIIYTKIDVVMLSFLCSDKEVGIYNGAMQFYNFLFFIPAILNSFFFPLFSKYFGQKREFMKIFKTSFIFFASIGLMITIVAVIISKPMIIFLLSEKYLLSISVFKFLCLGIPFAFLNVLFGSLLISINSQRMLLITSMVSCVLNIIGNLLLIPIFRMYGAVVSTVITQVIYFFIVFLMFLNSQKKESFNEKKNYY